MVFEEPEGCHQPDHLTCFDHLLFALFLVSGEHGTRLIWLVERLEPVDVNTEGLADGQILLIEQPVVHRVCICLRDAILRFD